MQATWVETWGLWAVLVGAVIEGEATLVAAGYAVSQGYLPLAPTFTLAVLGASLGDHVFYLLGRLWGAWLFRRFIGLRRLRARAVLLLRRWGRLTAFAARFAYGLRVVVPLTIGAVRFPVPLFLPFNLLGAVAFAFLYLSLGYFFGEMVEEAIGRIEASHVRVLIAILVAGAALWIAREWKLFHPTRPPGDADAPDDDPPPGGGA